MLKELGAGFGAILVYYAAALAIVIPMRLLIRFRHESFRKILHCVLLGSLLVLTLGFETWWLCALSAYLFAALLYPVLAFLERFPWYSGLLTERKPGELKSSLILVFVMFASVVTVCWGAMGERLIALCSVFAWGLGDAAAALIGKRFGRHTISGQHIEGKKSAEGTAAMFAVSFVSVLALLIARGGMPWYGYLLTALLTAAVSALVELFSMGGRDTVTCPLAAMCVLLPMIHLFGG